jgi:hypothetical protein
MAVAGNKGLRCVRDAETRILLQEKDDDDGHRYSFSSS